jgi:hydroxymethylbilane synthase
LQNLNHPEVAEALSVERKVLRLFGGGCHLPLGCYCRKEDGQFQVFTSKAKDDEQVPDRYFTEAPTTKGLPEKVVAKFSNERKFPATVFISRDLSAQSYFRKAVEKNGTAIEARSLIRTVPIITKLDPYILKNVDWIFFTSKNGVEYFFNLQPQLPKKVKFGVMGSGSENALRSLGFRADYTGEGVDSADVGAEFAKLANGTTILFPAAEDPMRSIHQALSAATKMIDLPVYETVLEDDAEASSAEVLIFTSPSNVEAYFADNLLDVGQQVIAIGKSTGKKLDELSVKYKLPFSPDEIGLAEAVFGLEV